VAVNPSVVLSSSAGTQKSTVRVVEDLVSVDEDVILQTSTATTAYQASAVVTNVSVTVPTS
jgi:hypothetical protein